MIALRGAESASNPIETVSVADAAVNYLRSQLFSGALRPGQELRDTTIATELGIARPTVRMAVQRLVSEGLLERHPGRSARVRVVTAEDIADLYRVRRLIEFEAVRTITRQQRPLEGIAAVLVEFERAGEQWEAGPDADAAFHSAMVAAAGSPRLERMFFSIAGEMRLVVGLLRSRYASLAELYQEHAVLLDALRRRDEDGALELWAQHIADAERYLTTSLTETDTPRNAEGLR